MYSKVRACPCAFVLWLLALVVAWNCSHIRARTVAKSASSMRLLLLSVLFSTVAFAQNARSGAEYFVQRAGATWTYELPKKAKGKVVINSVVEWKSNVSISLGKTSGSATWRVKDGAWTERSGLRGGGEVILLPAAINRGTQWQAPASIDRGGGKESTYEVMALEAQVELPNGITVDHCLAILETPVGGGPGYTHYFAPNMGKVAAQGPDGWLYRLVEFRSGARGHSE